MYFRGHVPHDALASLYEENDVFVLPSVSEGMSNAALEAMACGLPLVMTRTGGATELLRDGHNGFLVDKGSIEDIVTVLRRYCADRALACRHGARSREMAESMSWQKVADAYESLYRQAVRSS